MAVQEGWYPDPHDNTKLRYWDGTNWTAETRENNTDAASASASEVATSSKLTRTNAKKEAKAAAKQQQRQELVEAGMTYEFNNAFIGENQVRVRVFADHIEFAKISAFSLTRATGDVDIIYTDQISGVTAERGLLFSSVSVVTPGRTVAFGRLPRSEAETFKNAVRHARDIARQAALPITPAVITPVPISQELSLSDKINELAALRLNGVITDEEYEAAKAKALGL